MYIQLTADLLDTIRTFIPTLNTDIPVSERLLMRENISVPIACMLSGLVLAQDDREKQSAKQARTAQIDNILDNKPLTVDPLLENWELPSGDYAYPCADDCGTNAIVQDPYDFDPSDHTCGVNGCVSEKLIITKQVA